MGISRFKYLYCLLFLSMSFLQCYGQKWQVKGVIKDRSGQVVKGANITLTDSLNSALLQFTTSNKKGAFTLMVQAGHVYQLRINALGYAELAQKMQFTAAPKPQQFLLTKATEKLEEVYLEA